MNKFLCLLILCAVSLYGQKFISPMNKQELDLEKTFVQRWAWYSICDFAHANNEDWGGTATFKNATAFNPEDVFPGSLVFVTLYGMRKFFAEVHPKIKNPYIIVSFAYDPEIPELMRGWLKDPKIIAWFGMSPEAIDSEKFHRIPLGIVREPYLFDSRNRINNFFEELRTISKINQVYVNFTIHEGRGAETEFRRNIYNILKKKPFSVMGPKRSFLDFMRDMAHYQFVASPTGDMDDCHRHWEALLAGCVPILYSTPMDELFDDLPVIIVKDYNDLTTEFLNNKYEEFHHKKFNLEKLYMQYWVDKIYDCRDKFLAEQASLEKRKS